MKTAMKKICLSLLLVVYAVHASEQYDCMQIYKYEITDLTAQLSQKLLQEDMQKQVQLLQTRMQESDVAILATQENMKAIDYHIQALHTGALTACQNDWLYENSKQFDHLYAQKARKIIEAFQKLSPVEKEKSAAVNNTTPEGFMSYWTAQMNMNEATFEHERNYNLQAIAYNNSEIMAQINELMNTKNNLLLHSNVIQDCQQKYGSLYQQYSEKLDDAVAATTKKNHAIKTWHMLAHQIVAQNKIDNVRREKSLFDQLKKENKEKLSAAEEKKAREIEAQKKVLADKVIALQKEEERKQDQRKANEEQLRLRLEQQEQEAAAKRQIKKNNAALLKNKVKAQEEQLQAQQEAAAQKKAKDKALVDLIAQATTTEDYEKIIMEQGPILMKDPGNSDPMQVVQFCKVARMIPYKTKLDGELKNYVTSLILADCPGQEVIRLSSILKQEQEEKLEALQLEFDAIKILLEEYRLLIDGLNHVDVQDITALKEQFVEKNNSLIATTGQGLAYFMGCYPELYFTMLDSYNYWQRGLNNVTYENNDDKLLAEQNIANFLSVLHLLHGDKGILNPTQVLGNKMMNYLKTTDVCGHVSLEELTNIKKNLHDAVKESTKDDIFKNVISMMVLGLDSLGILPEQQLPMTTNLIQRAILATKKLTPKERADKELEIKLSENYFQIFLQENRTKENRYTRDQLSDISRIFSSLVVALSKSNIIL